MPKQAVLLTKSQNMINFMKVRHREHIVMQAEGEIEKKYETLPSGLYEASDVGGPFTTVYAFKPIETVDKLIKFKTGVVRDTLQMVDDFFSDKTKRLYEDMQIARKMGIIFYGPPGTGKTATAMILMREITIQRPDTICIDFTGKRLGFMREVIRRLRRIQNGPIIAFMDEVEEAFSGNETEYLTFLDGTDSVNDFIFLGCTNFLDKIPRRIRERKSRIKHTIEIKSLPQEIYVEYIKAKIRNISESEVTKIAFLAEDKGLTIDELKNCLIDYHIEGMDIEKAIHNAKKYDKQDDW